MYAIIVRFEAHPGSEEELKRLLITQAENSLRDEPDCHVFDVVQDNENDGVFYLYELYTDQAAFMRHLETVHFNAFNTQAKPFVATKALFQGKRLASCLTNQI